MNDEFLELNSFTKKFTDKKIEDVILNRDVYYLVNPELRGIKNIVSENEFSMGIPLGKKGKQFEPSAFLLELLSGMSDNKLFVNQKAEWLFLCERDVFPESIIKDNARGKLFLVQNERDENLGLGRKVKKDNKLLIQNVFDRGDFLRRER